MTRRLSITDLHASAGGVPILRGIDLELESGEVHAVMGPNGSGKSTLSHVLAGRSGYEVTGGRVMLDDVDLLALAPWERAAAGLFLAMQYPTEVPGVRLDDALGASVVLGDLDAATRRAKLDEEAERIGLDPTLLERSLNVDLSGGEKKRNETLQLAMLEPAFVVLDEIDSGLDIDALRAVGRRVELATTETSLGVIAITHYARLLEVLEADRVHVLVKGRIVESGGPELADRLEDEGYDPWLPDEPGPSPTSTGVDPLADPFADPFA